MFGRGHHDAPGHHEAPVHHAPPQLYGSQPHVAATSVNIAGAVVKVFSESDPNFNLAARGDEVVMAPANDFDQSQQWIKDDSWASKAKDSAGLPAFALVNKSSGKALRHAHGSDERVVLETYHQSSLNEVVLWTISGDVGHGWHAIRPINNIKLNLDIDHGTREGGGIHDGQAVLLFKWKDKENQHWQIKEI